MSEAGRILVVDDEPEALLLASYVLEQAGYEVLQARTGDACLESVRAHRPDLVLLDRMLPDADGLEVCRQIKHDPALSDTFVLLYSALKTTSDQQASGLESGADGYLVRPIGNRELVARVNSILRVKRARDASRRSEGRFRSLFENALVGIYRITPEGDMLLANPALLQMLGYPSFEELARHTRGQDGHGPGGNRTAFTEAIERDGTVSGSESTWIRRDGSVVHVRESARAVRDPAGNTLYYEGIVEDVTERKEANERVRASEQKFRDVFDSAGDAILIHDLSGHLLEANHMACEQLGYSREQLLRMNMAEIEAPPYAVQFAQRIRLLRDRGQAVFEGAHVARDGAVIPIELNKRIIEYEGQQAVLSIARDISERVRVEAELRRSARRLEGLRAIDQAILDGHLPEQVAQAALKRIQNMVPCAGAWVTTSGPGGQGSRVLAAQFERPDGALASAFQALVQGSPRAARDPEQAGSERGSVSPGPTIAAMRTAGVRTYATVPIKAKERTIGQLVLVSDIERRFTPEEIEIAQELAAEVAVAVRQADLRAALAAERASLVKNVEERTADLRIANAELARAARLKDEFLAAMSHELRTPLNAILGLSESLLEGVYGAPNERQARSLRSIAESGHHLLDLINDILDVAKIEADKLDLDLGMVSIPLVCESSMGLVKQAATKKRLKTSLQLSSGATQIEADGRRLKQILVNLLSNAVKFTPEGGEIGLQVEDDPANGMMRFTVWDTGIGIAAEDLKRLFQPFVQVDSSLSRRYSGTGLGLALVHRLTQMHGGHVSVESEVEAGSRFTVSLPWRVEEAARAQPAQFEPSVEPDAVPVAGPQLAQRLILLAEDDETNVNVMQDYLEAKGCCVVVAHDGHEAIAQVQQQRPDLILMDIQMPNMDGLEATRRLRSDVRTADIPVIALTALAMPGDRERCLEAGADAYLSKPVRLRELAELVEVYSDRN